MAMTQDEIRDLQRAFEDAIRNTASQGSLGAGASPNIDMRGGISRSAQKEAQVRKKATEMAEKHGSILDGLNKELKKFNQKIEDSSALITGAWNETFEKLSSKGVDQAVKVLRGQMYRYADLQDMQMETVDDLNVFLEKRAELEKEAYELKNAMIHGERLNAAEHQQTLSAVENKLKKMDKALHNTNNQIQEYTVTWKEAGQNVKEFGTSLAAVGASIAGLASATKSVAQPFLKYGTGVEATLTSFTAGMNPEQMAMHLAENRRSMNAMGLSMDDFRAITEQGNEALTTFTGDLGTSTKLQAQTMEIAQRFGASDVDEFMNRQVDTFKRFQKAFSMTGEQFMEMNKQLRDSSAVNKQIYKLDVTKRAQAHQDNLMALQYLRTQGLLQEQAMAVVEAMAEIGGMKAKDRIKQAAKLQAVGGAMGFGGEASEAATIMRRNFTQDGDRERFAQLQSTMQERTGSFMSQGLPFEMMAQTMIEKTGLESMLGENSKFATLNTEQTMRLGNIEDVMHTNNELYGSGVALADQTLNFIQSPLFKLIGAISATVGSILAAIVTGKVMGRALGKKGRGGKLSGKLDAADKWTKAKTGGKMGLKALGRVGGPLIAGGMIAKDVVDAVNGDTSNANTGALVGSVLGGAVGLIGGPMGAALGAGLGNWAGEAIGGWFDRREEEGKQAKELAEKKKTLRASEEYKSLAALKKDDLGSRRSEKTKEMEGLQKKLDAQRKSESENSDKQVKMLEEQIELNKVFVERIDKLIEKTEQGDKGVQASVDANTEQAKQDAEESRKENKKNVRIQWARVNPAMGGT